MTSPPTTLAPRGLSPRIIDPNSRLPFPIAYVRLEQRVRRDVDRDQSIASLAGCARPALSFQPDLLTARNSSGDFDFDVLARRQVHTGRRTLRRVRKCDR